MQRNELDFTGQNIYVGIDVHQKSWNVSIMSQELHHKTFNQPPVASTLVDYLTRTFPGGVYQSAYEAGFSGLWSHYELTQLGVKNIVVNPSDIPGTQKERLQKTDALDSRKIARSLRAGELNGIYIPALSTLETRSLLRIRSAIVKDLSRMKHRIKSLLMFYGITYPACFERSTTHWSKRFMQWLSQEVTFSTHQGREALTLLVQAATEQRKLLLEATNQIRKLSATPPYAESLRLIRTVPGVGLIIGMTFLAEVENMERFKSTDKLAGYVGLIPMCHNSGDTQSIGEMTFRGQSHLRSMLIECSWTAARIDPALLVCFSNLTKRMEQNKAIIRIARKVLNRIYYVLKYKKEYVCSIVK